MPVDPGLQQEAERAQIVARLLKAATRYGLDPASGPLLMVEAAHAVESRDQRIKKLEEEVERRVYPTARNSGG